MYQASGHYKCRRWNFKGFSSLFPKDKGPACAGLPLILYGLIEEKPFRQWSLHPPTPSTSNRRSAFRPMDLLLQEISYKWSRTILVLLSLASFTCMFQVHVCCSMYQNLFDFVKKYYSVAWIYHLFWIHSSAGGHLVAITVP